MPDIVVGAVAPESLRVIINQGSSGVDLSTVTSVSLVVLRKGDSMRQTWTTNIAEKTQTTITVVHPFASQETDGIGIYSVLALLTIPSGTVRARCGQFKIVNI